MLACWQIIIKITVEDSFATLRQRRSSKEFYLFVLYPWNFSIYKVFPKLKNPDGSNVIGEDEEGLSTFTKENPEGRTMSSHTGTGDRVGGFVWWQIWPLQPGSFVRLQASGYHCRDTLTTWTVQSATIAILQWSQTVLQ